MTVKQLIAKLQKLPQSALVVMSCDGEGNNFHPLSVAEESIYRPESTWAGQLVGHGGDYKKERGDRSAVVLWPVN